MRSRGAAAFGVAVLATALLAGCQEDDQPEPPDDSTAAMSAPAHLTFGVYGDPADVATYRTQVREWNAHHNETDVRVVATSESSGMASRIESGSVPDVFLISRWDLPGLLQDRVTQPVGDLLDAQGVDFGDDFQRDASLAFAADDELQCMPYGVSPMVIYFNRDLVDFSRMRARGLDTPDSPARWTFEQFATAARFATRPRQGVRGVQIEHTLRGLTPFILSAGGDVYDDDDDPTSLAFSSDDTRGALEEILPLFRNQRVTLPATKLQKHSALEWFERGKVAMIEGDRSLTPELRKVKDLDFDVLPMPVVDSAQTVAEFTGMCMSRDTPDPEVAAEFMADMLGRGPTAAVTRNGHLVPANIEVAQSKAFLQPRRRPENAEVFVASGRPIVPDPLLGTYDELDRAVEPQVRRLFFVGPLDLDAVTAAIDESSRPVLDPDYVPQTSSGSPSGSPSESEPESP